MCQYFISFYGWIIFYYVVFQILITHLLVNGIFQFTWEGSEANKWLVRDHSKPSAHPIKSIRSHNLKVQVHFYVQNTPLRESAIGNEAKKCNIASKTLSSLFSIVIYGLLFFSLFREKGILRVKQVNKNWFFVEHNSPLSLPLSLIRCLSSLLLSVYQP